MGRDMRKVRVVSVTDQPLGCIVCRRAIVYGDRCETHKRALVQRRKRKPR